MTFLISSSPRFHFDDWWHRFRLKIGRNSLDYWSAHTRTDIMILYNQVFQLPALQPGTIYYIFFFRNLLHGKDVQQSIFSQWSAENIKDDGNKLMSCWNWFWLKDNGSKEIAAGGERMMRIQRCLCGVSGPDSGAAALPPDVKDDL